jgi:hypothetical protein
MISSAFLPVNYENKSVSSLQVKVRKKIIQVES